MASASNCHFDEQNVKLLTEDLEESKYYVSVVVTLPIAALSWKKIITTFSIIYSVSIPEPRTF